MSAWITMKRSSGVVSRHAEESKTVPDDQLACPAQKWSNSGTVTVSSMMGLYVCVIFIISTGVVARLILECMPKPLYNRIVPAKWRTVSSSTRSDTQSGTERALPMAYRAPPKT